MGNYRGPPERYDPNYHKNKWKRARTNSGDSREGGAGGSPLLNGMGGNTNFGRNERIQSDTYEQLTLETQQLVKERALAVKEKRDDDAQRADFEITWRGVEYGYYHMAFNRADTITHPAEKYKYLLELQVNQNEARRRMEDWMKRETPSVLRAIMAESPTARNQATLQARSANTSTSALPQRAFVSAQVVINTVAGSQIYNNPHVPISTSISSPNCTRRYDL
ncbi:hypothetical protein BG005_008489 [Podila minutissima]|nr:hypothetical protein BG005_008489 [Podila minutissima]